MSRSSHITILTHIGLHTKKLIDQGVPHEEAFQRVCDALHEVSQRLFDDNPGLAESLQQIFSLGGAFALAWAENAFATVEIDPKLAASLMATSIPTEHLKDVHLPWRCFCIHIPEGVLGDREDEDHLPTHTLVLQAPDGRIRTFDFGGTIMGYNEETSLAEYADLKYKEAKGQVFAHDSIGPDVGAKVKRVSMLLGRLLVGVCLEFESPKYRSQIASVKKTGIKLKHGKPKISTVLLRRPVVLDVRASVKDYVQGTRSSVTVRSLIRGHWKNQPCGAGMKDRKWMHIEPYWRGPEDGPVAERPHIIR